jgi:YD repeat-containing protein
MKKRITIIIFLCVTYLMTTAQSVADMQSPKVVPPSPDAASLGKYGQIQVDKSSGIPQISVPIYDIKTPRFTVPISLSYIASGVKVDEVASWVGMNWSLNAGGVVTRTILGLPDDWNYGFLNQVVPNASDILWPRDSLFVVNSLVAQTAKDLQPDNFFYNFNGQAGSFVFGEDKKPVLTPYKALRISFDSENGFIITDEQGDKYIFNTVENVECIINQTLVTPKSSWYLTKMISADLSDTVQFNYTQDSEPQYDFSYCFTQNLGPDYNDPSHTGLGPEKLWPLVESTNERDYLPVHLSNIIFNGGKVDFIGKNGRLDNANISLDSIIIYSYNNATGQYDRMKSFKLLTDYFYSQLPNPPPYLGTDEPSKHRLKLLGIQENDQNNAPGKSYQFDYNSTMLPPVHNFGQDKWGYYNGHYTNKTLLESQSVLSTDQQTVFTIGGDMGANRSVSPSDAQAGILQRITYPTKGYTEFTFESNLENVTQQIQHQVQAAAVGFYQETDTTFYTPTTDNIGTGGSIFHVQIRKTSDIPYTLPVNPFVEVTDMTTGNILYSQSANQNTDIDVTSGFPLVAGHQYRLVAVAKGGDINSITNLLPKASITTSYLVSTMLPTPVGGLRIASIKNYNSDNSIISTETYKYGQNESGTGELLAAGFTSTTFVSHVTDFQLAGGGSGSPGGAGAVATASVATYFDNSIYSLSMLNGSPIGYNTVTVYNGDPLQNAGKSIYKFTIFSDSILICPPAYANSIKPVPVTWKNGEPVSEAIYKNTGDNEYALEREKLTSYNYIGKPNGRGLALGLAIEAIGFDPLAAGPGSQYNIIQLTPACFYWFNYPISSGIRVPGQTVVNDYDPTGTNILMTDTTKYYYDNETLYLPTRVENIDSKGLSMETKSYRPLDKSLISSLTTLSANASLAIDSMIARNIISPQIMQVQYRHNILTRLSLTNYKLWDNNIISPENMQEKISTNPIETRLQFNKYDAKGNLLEFQRTNDLKEVYLWGYNSKYPVAKIQNTTYDVAKTYITQSLLDNPVSDATLRSQLNNLRGIPNSMVTTFSYKPLVGMTSQTDPAGRTTFYEFDGLGRLTAIKDQDGNVIKTIQYHYKGQALP